MKKKAIIQTIFTCIILLSPMLVLADAPDFVDDINDAPIDGGLSLLVAAGVGYGAKKLKEKKILIK